MKENLQTTTKSFENFLVEEFLPIRRPTKKIIAARAVPLDGISKFHSIFFNSHNDIKGLVLTCIKCTINKRCSTCNAAQVKGSRTKKNKNPSPLCFNYIGIMSSPGHVDGVTS